MVPLPDQIRDVPEFAVRLYLGADCLKENGNYLLRLDDENFKVPEEVFNRAAGIAKALTIKERRVETAGDILNLRHAAEDMFISDVFRTNTLIRILFCPAGELANAYYRAMLPASLMTEYRMAFAHHTHRLDLKKSFNYEILWIQLAVSPIILNIAEEAKKNGIKIVYDIDDRFDSIPEDNPAAAFYKGEKVDQIWRMIDLADMVTVSTEPLAEFLRPRAKKVVVLPNMPPAGIWPNPVPLDPKEFRILWAGSPSHRADLAIAAPAIRNILAEEKGKVRFTCFGENIPEDLMPVKDYVDIEPFVDFEKYPEKLISIGANVAIAPLVDNPFNQAKSAIKYLEYSTCQYPSLLSPVGEYESIVKKDGAPALLVEDNEWESSIRSAMFSKHTFQEMGDQAHEWVKKNRCIVNAQAKPWAEAAKLLVKK